MLFNYIFLRNKKVCYDEKKVCYNEKKGERMSENKTEVKKSKVFLTIEDGNVSKTIEKDLNDYKMLWSLTSQINWSEDYKKTNEIRDSLIKNMSKEQASQLRHESYDVTALLSHSIKRKEKFEGLYGGDDSFSDLLSEIVSYGKDFVLSVLKEEDKAIETLKKNGVHESFDYILPYKMDFDEKADFNPKEDAKNEIKEIKIKIEKLDKMDFLAEEYKNKIKKETLMIFPYLKAVEDDNLSYLEGKESSLDIFLRKFDEKAKYANNALRMSAAETGDLTDSFFSTDIITPNTKNIIQDYIKEKTFAEIKLDFSEFGSKYIEKQSKDYKIKATRNKI